MSENCFITFRSLSRVEEKPKTLLQLVFQSLAFATANCVRETKFLSQLEGELVRCIRLDVLDREGEERFENPLKLPFRGGAHTLSYWSERASRCGVSSFLLMKVVRFEGTM